MSRISQLFLVAICFLSSLLPSAFADDDPTTVTSETEAPARPRTKITPDKYPYGKPKEATGVRFSEYQSLAVPSWLLVAVFLVFLAGVGYIIYRIFDVQQEKERKKVEKQKLREDKKHKGSKKGSRKAD